MNPVFTVAAAAAAVVILFVLQSHCIHRSNHPWHRVLDFELREKVMGKRVGVNFATSPFGLPDHTATKVLVSIAPVFGWGSQLLN